MEKFRSILTSSTLRSRRLSSAWGDTGGRTIASCVSMNMRERDSKSVRKTLHFRQPRMLGAASALGMQRGFSGEVGEERKGPEDFDSLDDYLLSIDTSIPENKRAHVEALKKSIRGGPRSERSLYRDVPTQEEIEAIKFQGNFLPKIAPNAEELIDWALSHVPERAGPRRSRRAKRMLRKWEIKRADDARRKSERVAALARKQAKRVAHRERANQYRLEAARLRGEVTEGPERSDDAKQAA